MTISNYTHILQGLPIMYLIVVVAMCVVIGAMAMDAAFGWRKVYRHCKRNKK